MKTLAPAIALLSLIFASTGHAGLSQAAVTTLSFKMHGLYTTSDPTCQTGLVATIPLSKAGTTYNLAASPTFGDGPIPADIQCVVMVIANKITTAWAAGTYTTTSNGNPDSVCNPGGTENVPLCNGVDADRITWPTQIQQDFAALGLTPATACQNANAAMLIPLYLSTHSYCPAGIQDALKVPGCSASGANTNAQSQFPMAAESATTIAFKGIKLSAPGNKNGYTFVMDPDGYIGPDPTTPANCILGGMKFGFR